MGEGLYSVAVGSESLRDHALAVTCGAKPFDIEGHFPAHVLVPHFEQPPPDYFERLAEIVGVEAVDDLFVLVYKDKFGSRAS